MSKKTGEILIQYISSLANEINRPVTLMEVCGTHTQAVSRFGIKEILPKNIKLVAGPGCPVCVTSQEDIDAIVNLALRSIPVASYGDVMRIPGYYGSLDQAKEKGTKVFSVYSVEEALGLARKYPDLIFFGLGFETTTPMTAWVIKKAKEENLDFSVYSTHKLFIPAMKTLLDMGEIKIDGFIDPGHVSTIIGTEQYKILPVPQVITGFEQDDVLMGIYMLLKQIKEGRAEIENQYTRSVRPEGNPDAYKLIFEIFEPADGNWRGFGIIPGSGLKIKDKYKKFDAKVKYKDILDKVDFSKSQKPTACKCGEIIRGLLTPSQCSLFKKVCNPENPAGPCMVSVEGVCNVEYRNH